MFLLLKATAVLALALSNLNNDHEVKLISKNVKLVCFGFFWLTLFSYFYTFFPLGHLNHIGARIAASTWQDVFYMMSAVVVVNFAFLVSYLLVTCTVHFIRRLW